jgi:hypothetical protein
LGIAKHISPKQKSNDYKQNYPKDVKMENQITAVVETITPEMAQNYLDANHENQRPLKNARIKKYAEDIANNMWLLNGESIIIADDGTILDGQHRLSAIVLANKSVEIMVVKGIPKVQDGIDTFGTINAENRSNADVLYIEGIRENTADVVKYIRLYESFKIKRLKEKPSGIPYKNHEILEKSKTYNIDEIQERLDRAYTLHSRCDLFSKPVWILLSALEHKISGLHEFIEKVAECNETDEMQGSDALIRFADRQGEKFRSVKLVWIAFFKAFHLEQKGIQVKNLRINLGMSIDYPEWDGYEEA